MKLKSLAEACYELFSGNTEFFACISELNRIYNNLDFLRLLLRDPAISAEKKFFVTQKIIEKILENINNPENTAKILEFLSFLSTKNSLDKIFQLWPELQKVQKKSQNTLDIEIFSVCELSESEINRIKNLFNKNIKNININSQIDASLVAGFKIKTENYIVDNSLKKWLEDLSKSIKSKIY